MTLEKEKLRMLSPTERIRRLREIEEESKKELDEAEKLIQESMEDLRKEEAVSEVEMPEAGEVDITRLFGKEEKLEETVKEAKIKEVDEKKVMYNIGKIKEYMEHVGEGPANDYTMEKVGKMSEQLRAIDYTQLTKHIADELNATRNIIYETKKHLGMR